MFSSCLSICRDPTANDSEEVQYSSDIKAEFEDPDSDTTSDDDGGTGCQSGRRKYMLPRRKLTRVEELEWIKPLMDKLWPKIDQALYKIMKDVVEPKIQDKVPYALKGLTFTKFTLGKTPANVGPITIWDAPCLKEDQFHRGLELHIDVKLESKLLDVELAVGALNAGIKTCSIKGTLVLRLDPLLDHSPIIGGLVIYFLDPPVLDLGDIQLNEMGELGFTEGRLTRILENLIANRLVLPNVWFRPFLQNEEIVDTATLRDPKPVGVLRATVIEGRHLYGNDFHLFSKATSDPYVRIRLADDEWTSATRVETCHPKWLTDPETIGSELSPDEVQHDFLVYDVGQTLRIEVYDWNQIVDHVLIGRSEPITVQDALGRSRKTLDLLDCTGAQKRGQLVLQFDWLKVTAGCLDDDHACMVRVKFDEVYVPEDIDFNSAKIQVTLPDGRQKSTPFTSPPNTLPDTVVSERRLDVEYVMCFQMSQEVAMTDPLQIHLISNNQVTLGVGKIPLETVMKEPDKQKEWIEEPLELERPPEENVISFLNFGSAEEQKEATPIRAEVTVSVMGLQPVATKAAIAHMRKRCQQAEDWRMPSRGNSMNQYQPWVGRDTTKCTGSVESLDWFNAFFMRLWPKIASYVQRLMEDQEGTVTQRMQAAVPQMLKGMYFNKFKLGGKTPVFGPIKICEAPERLFKDGKDTNQGSEIRLGVKLDSESQIELSVMAVKVGIHRLQVRGEIAIRFEPLVPQTPVIGGLVLCFLNPPKLAMDYKHAAQIVGYTTLEPMVRSAIDRAIAKALVMPNVISVPIGSEEKGVDRTLLRCPRPLGIVRVRAKAATGLPDGHLHLLSRASIQPYLRVRVADDEWHSSEQVGSSPTWTHEDQHCFWYYDVRQTIQIEVLDKGRFNPMHAMGQAKPMLVKDAVENSGTPIELWPPAAGLDEITEEESCGTVDMEFELLQPKPGLRASCELCMLRIKIDKVYVSEEFPQPVALHAKCNDSEKTTPFVSATLGKPKNDSKDRRSQREEKDAKPKRVNTMFLEEPFERRPVELPVEYVIHLLLKQEDLKTHQLELQLIDRKREVLAAKDVELKQLVERKAFRRTWGSEKNPLLNLRGKGGKCQAELEVQISGLDVQQLRAKRAVPRFNPDFMNSKPRCFCSRCKLRRESWFLLACAANALVEGAACLIGGMSGFLLVLVMNLFGPRHKQQGAVEDEDEEGPVTAVPATLYEGGETTRSSKERTPQRPLQRPVSMEPGSPGTPTRLQTKERLRANTGK